MSEAAPVAGASPKGRLNKNDWRSVARHTIAPIVAGAGLAGLDVVSKTIATGSIAIDWDSVVLAAKIAGLTGVWRLVYRWFKDLGGEQPASPDRGPQ